MATRKTRCPSCAAEIDAEVPVCPLCMRERTRAEIFAALRGEAPAQEAAAAKAGFGGTLTMLVGLGALAGGVYLYYQKDLFLKEAKTARVEAQSRARLDEARGEAEREAMAATARAQAGADREAADPQAPAAPAAPAAAHWTVQGLVYDLLTLAPVAGARLTFTSRESGERVKAASGPDGRYSVALPKIEAGGYDLAVRHKRYGDAYLEDMQPPLRAQDKGRRLEALAAAGRSAVLHVPILPPAEEDALDYDLVLLPPPAR